MRHFKIRETNLFDPQIWEFFYLKLPVGSMQIRESKVTIRNSDDEIIGNGNLLRRHCGDYLLKGEEQDRWLEEACITIDRHLSTIERELSKTPLYEIIQ